MHKNKMKSFTWKIFILTKIQSIFKQGFLDLEPEAHSSFTGQSGSMFLINIHELSPATQKENVCPCHAPPSHNCLLIFRIA